jgi:hypothetical protein
VAVAAVAAPVVAGAAGAAPAGGAAAGASGAAASKAGAGAQASKLGGMQQDLGLRALQRLGQGARQQEDGEEQQSPAAVIATVIVAVVVLLVVAVIGVVATLISAAAALIPDLTAYSKLPDAAQPFVAIYQDAASSFDQNPYLLMAIHESESTFSTSSEPGVHSGVNRYGCCAGPMQFYIKAGASPQGAGGTWEGYRSAFERAERPRPESYPGRVEGPHPNVYDSFDAIYAGAAYLEALGASRELDSPQTKAAMTQYKGGGVAAGPYADADIKRAKALQAIVLSELASPQSNVVAPTPGEKAVLWETGRNKGLASAPDSAPIEVKRMIEAANKISDKPYLLKHFATHLNNTSYDCSSSTSHVLWAGGKFGEVPWCSLQLERYGEAGYGRWVTVHTHGPCGPKGHVFLEIAGLRFDTNYLNRDYGPNAGERGPRWRTWGKDNAEHAAIVSGFVHRHPEGL